MPHAISDYSAGNGHFFNLPAYPHTWLLHHSFLGIRMFFLPPSLTNNSSCNSLYVAATSIFCFLDALKNGTSLWGDALRVHAA